MKKLTLFIILLLPFSSYSQNKKDLLISGGLGGYYSRAEVNFNGFGYNSGKEFICELNPNLGFFFIKSLSIGLGVDLINNSTISEEQITIRTFHNYLLVSPFFKYYFPFRLFIQAQYNFGEKISKYESDNTPGDYNLSYKSTEFLSGFGIGIGYLVKINNSISKEPSFKYLQNFVNSSYERYGSDNLTGGKGNQQMFLFNVAITNFISLK